MAQASLQRSYEALQYEPQVIFTLLREKNPICVVVCSCFAACFLFSATVSRAYAYVGPTCRENRLPLARECSLANALSFTVCWLFLLDGVYMASGYRFFCGLFYDAVSVYTNIWRQMDDR
jgi:hypothetical protein